MNSLSTRVLIGLASALFVVVTILFSSAYLLEKSKLEQQFEDYQLNTLANLEVTLAQPIFNYDFEQISAALSTSLKSSKIYAFQCKTIVVNRWQRPVNPIPLMQVSY